MNNYYHSPKTGKLSTINNENLSFPTANQIKKLVNNLSKKHLIQVFLMAMFLMGSMGVKAQTPLISPTGNGGFESADFAANGWTVENYAANNTNKWFVGSASVASAGSRAAYLSDNVTGATHNYLLTGASRVMFWRDIVFPAGEPNITLSFKLKGNGEASWDELSVFIQNSATAPSTAQPAASGSSNPSITNATRLTTLSMVGTTYTTYTFTISAADAGNAVASTTRRLIFYWENDGGGGAQPPASIDEISLISSPPINYVSNAATANWSNSATWSPAGIPTAFDNVTIADGHTITIDSGATALCNNLTVGQGATGVLIFNSTTARTITVGGNLTIASGGTFQSANSGTATTHALSIAGNITNNGTLDFSTNTNTAGAGITFTGAADQVVSGTGATNDLYTVTMSKSALANLADFNLSNFTVRGSSSSATGALLTGSGTGTIKFSGSNTFSGTLWSSASYTIASSLGIWLNNSNFTVQGLNGSPTNNGLIRITNGSYTLGTVSGNEVTGSGLFNIEGGTLNVASRLIPAGTYTQSGGTANVSTVGNASATIPSLRFNGTAFTMSGGTMILHTKSSNTPDVNINPTTTTITGGILQLGSASTPAAQTFTIRGNLPNLVVNATNNPSVSLNNATVIYGDLTLNGTGTFSNTGSNLTMRGGSVTNPGNISVNSGSVLNLSSSATAVLSFTSSFGNQSITNSGTITSDFLPSVTVNNTFAGGTVTIPSGISLMGGSTLNLTSGVLTVGGAGTITFIQSGASTATFAMTRTNGSLSATSAAFGVATPTTLTYNYNTSTAAQTTGLELPASVGSTTPLTSMTINNAQGTILNKPVNTATLTLTAGQLTTTDTNLVTVTGTTTGSISRSTGYVNGPLARTLPASNSTGTYTFPVGKGTYNPFELITPTTTSSSSLAVVKAEAFDANSNGTAGTNMSALNTNRYWAASVTTNPTSFTSSFVKLTDSTVASTSGIASGATVNGTYNFVGGSNPTIVVGTSIQSTAPAATSLPGFFVIGTRAVSMSYVSSTTTQSSTAITFPSSANQQIIGVQIVTTGNASPLTLANLNFNTTGSTNAADIAAARVFSTGTSSTFATTTQFGSDVPTPSGAFTVSGSLVLAEGTNYFWLVYDVAAAATNNNVLDAQSVSIDYGTVQTPTVTNPAGTRTIRTQLNGTYLIGVSQIAPNYTKLTDAIADLNTLGVSGPVIFSLQGDYSSASETFPLIINAFTGASALNKVTIKPATTATISGSVNSNSILRLNGADYVTIDGSNSGGTDKSLTITNTSTTSPTAVSLVSLGTSAGATNNTVKNCNISTGSNSATSYGISIGGSPGNAADDNDNNTIQNNAITKAYYGIYAGATASGQNDNLVISGNTIGTSTAGSEITFTGVIAIQANNATISSNTISNILLTGAADPIGINISTGTVNSTVSRNIISGVTAANTGGYGGRGIQINTANATSNITLSNNAISDIKGSGWSVITTDAIMGIAIGNVSSTTGGINLYYNSVNLGSGTFTGHASGTLSAALAVNSGVTNLDIRNNAFANNLVNATASGAKAYAIYSGAANTAYTTINYNSYYVSGTQGVLGFLTSDRVDLAGIQTGFGQNVNSVSGNPLFNTSTNLIPSTGSSLIGAGTPVSVTIDINGTTRNATTPYIGAYEQQIDLSGPTINYTALANNCGSGARTLTTTITDGSGVPTSGAGLPVLYWKIGAGAYASSVATYISGNTYEFSLGTGSANGDVISYYIVAQDTAGTPNLSASPSAGATGFSINPPAVSTPPTTPNTYTNLTSLSGTYTVGAGGNYTTLTAAITAFNGSCLAGPVTFSLTDASYAGETFPITINSNIGTSAINTLTIKPATGISPSISGNSASGLVILNGADYVIIEGCNNPQANSICPVVTSTRNLTFTNTNTGTSSAVVWLQTTGSNGATNNIVRNCNIIGNSPTTTLVGLGAGSSAISATSLGTGNNSNTFENNNISKVQYGIYSQGASIATKNTGNNIVKNLINTASPNQVSKAGIHVGFENNINITGNSISNISGVSSSYAWGINLGNITSTTTTAPTGGNEVTNATVTNNIIGSIRAASTYGVSGIVVAPATSGTTLIANNAITDVAANGTAGDCGIGILAGGGAGSTTNIYFNSVSMSATLAGGNGPNIALAIGGTTPTVNIKNNVLTSTGNTGSGANRAIALAYSSTTGNYTNLVSSNNDLYVSGGGTTLGVGITGGFAGGTVRVALSDWQTETGRDANSISSNPNFNSATNLALQAGSPALATGVTGTGITTDVVCATRTSPPSMGAYDAPSDNNPPTISYTALTNTCTAGARTISATITDAISGVPTSGPGLPVLYWKINSGTYTASTGTYVSGNLYDFTLGAGSASGDVISYYIAAQDNSSNSNVAVSPSGASGFTSSPPVAATPPASPSSYINSVSLSGPYTVGTGGNYTTLTAAVNAYNNACLTGPVVFNLTDATYSAGEIFPLTINENAMASATFTLTIKPAALVNTTITALGEAFILNGADHVTIDGSNNGTSSRNMTVLNTDTVASNSSNIWLRSVASPANGSTNNTIKNIIVTGNSLSTTWAGIELSGSTGNTPEAPNSNNTIENNLVSTAQYGIFVKGATANDVSNHVLNNTMGSATAANKLGLQGIYIENQQNIIVSANTVSGVATSANASCAGISVIGTISGGLIDKNIVSDIKNSIAAGRQAFGIQLSSSSASAGLTLTNNMVFDVANSANNATLTRGAHGIAIISGGGYNLYHNTVALNTNPTAANTVGINAALYVASAVTALDIRNNILANSQTTAVNRYAIYSDAANTAFTTINYNNYSSTGTNLGFLSSARVTLADIQTGFGQNVNSSAVTPVFVSSANVHLDPANNSVLDNTATLIGGITTDIDGDPRPAGVNPDMGADEFTTINCTVASVSGTATLGVSSFCTSGSTTLSATGYSTGNGTTYEWEKSTDNFTTPISMGAASSVYASISTGTVTATTQYRLKVVCSADAGNPAYSGIATLTIYTPATITATATQPSVCSGGSGTSLTASGATSYSWTSNPAGFTSTSATPAVTPTVTTIYSVVGVDANGCTTNTATATVTVYETPSALSVSPSAGTVCSGTVVTLVAAGGTITGAPVPGSVTVASPTTNSAILDGSATGVTQNISVTGVPAGSTITKIEVNFTLNHEWLNDAEVTLTAPNGKVVNLVADQGAGGPGVYSNVTITSDTSASALSTSSANITGTYRANAVSESALIANGTFGTNYTQTFSNLFSIANGTWAVRAFDDVSDDTGVLNNSAITIYYTTPSNNPASTTWSATVGNLYTSPAAAGVNDGVNGLVGTGSYTTVYAKPTSPSTSVSYTATANNNGCTSTGSTSVSINALPVFTVAPTTICKGTPGTLTAVSGDSNSYSWVPTTGGATLTGNPRSVNPAVTTTYNVTATSNTTTPACQSTQQVTVIVNDPGTINSITPTRTVSPDQPTTFVVATTGGTNMTYKWQVNNNVDGWQFLTDDYEDENTGNYSGVNTPTLGIQNITLAFDTYKYRCIVKSDTPCTDLISGEGILNVTSTGFVTQPADVNLCGSTTAQFSIVTSGDEPYDIQWQMSTDNFENYTDIVDGFDAVSGLTFDVAPNDDLAAKTLNVSGITPAHNNYQFRCRLDFFLDSATATLTVNTPVSITNNLSLTAVDLCRVTNTTNLVIDTSGSVASVVWKYSSVPNPADWSALPTVANNTPTGTTYTVTNPLANQYKLAIATSAATPVGNYYYKAILIGSGSGLGKCADLESNMATLTVHQPIVAVTPNSASYCDPGTGVTLTASGANLYSWSPSTGLDTASGAVVVASPTTTTSYIVTGTDAFGCTNTATANVNAGSSIVATASNSTALSCPGSTVQLSSTVNRVVPTVFSLINPATVGGFESGATFPLNGWTVINGANNTWSVGNAAGIQQGANAAYIGTNNVATANSSVNHFYRDIAIPAGVNSINLSFYLKMAIIDDTFDYLNVYTTTTSNTPVAGTLPGTGYTNVYSNTATAYSNFTLANATLPNNLAGTTVRLVFTYKSDGVTPFSAPAIDAISLTATAADTYTYAWTSSPAGFTSNLAAPTPAPTVATTYNLTVTSPSGCTANASVLVNVQSTPPTITTPPVASTKCIGQTATFTVAATSVTSPITYKWRKDGVDLVNGPGISGATLTTLTLTGVTAASVGNYDVVVTVCGNLSTTSNPVALAVNALPTVAVTPSSSTYCAPAGAAATLTASGANSYTWSPSTGLSSTTTDVVNATPTTTQTYTVTGTDGNGCTNTATSTVTVFQSPVLTNLTATPSTVCSGSNSQLLATTNAITAANMLYSSSTGQSLVTITSPTTVTAVTSGSLDDGYITVSPSFTFNYLGTDYTSFGVGTNGYIVLGGNSSTVPTSFSSISGNVIYAFGRDGNLNTANAGDLTHGPATGGKYVFQTNKNAGATNGNPSATIYATYQIVLWGASSAQPGRIDIIYGANAGTPATSAAMGIKDAAGNLVNAISGSTSSTTLATAWPTAGQAYSFVAPVTSYSWSPSTFLSSSTIANPVATGVTATTTYVVTATRYGCTANADVTVVATPRPTATISGTTTLCRNATPAPMVTFTGANGTAPYVFTYKLNGGSNQTISTVGSNNTVTITVPTTTAGVSSYTLVSVQDSTAAACSQTQTGTATVTVVENITYYRDADNDGYGNPAITLISCNPSEPGYVMNNTDCNDNAIAIHPNATEICFNNIDDDCDGLFSETCPPALTHIAPSLCGTTLPNVKSTITATIATYSGPYTVTYLFRITNLTATPQVTVDLPRAFRNFNLGMTSIRAYGSQYSVMVAAVVNGEQQAFSAPCLITTPSIPTSQLAQCGGTATSMTSSISINAVPYALAYQIEIAQQSSPTVVKEFTRLYNNFSMILVTNAPNALPLLYDTNYIVRIKVKVLIDGEEVWGQYGAPCIVTTPPAPEAFMTSCGETAFTPASLTTVLYANNIPYTTMYRFTLLNEELGYSETIEHPFNSFRLSDFDAITPLVADETYSIIVDAMLFGNYYAGKDCQIKIPFPAKTRMVEESFEAKAYPNPFAENFMIDVKTASQTAIDIKVYDMVGRLVEQRKVSVSDMKTTTVGDRYPSGVYNVIITQGEEVKTLRVVKR